jgi:hypothetical protein
VVAAMALVIMIAPAAMPTILAPTIVKSLDIVSSLLSIALAVQN